MTNSDHQTPPLLLPIWEKQTLKTFKNYILHLAIFFFFLRDLFLWDGT